jgi:hypothetical protein
MNLLPVVVLSATVITMSQAAQQNTSPAAQSGTKSG